ncbi:hypothetical protein ACWFMI_02310 [Nocardiopsis terrae]
MGSALVVGLFSVIDVTVAATFINGAYKWRQAYLALRQTKDHIEVADGERAQKNIHERRAHHSQMWAVGRGAEIDDSDIRGKIEEAKNETLEGFDKIDTSRYLISSEFVDLVNVGVLSRGRAGNFTWQMPVGLNPNTDLRSKGHWRFTTKVSMKEIAMRRWQLLLISLS